MALQEDAHLVCDAGAILVLLHQTQQVVAVLQQDAVPVYLEHCCFILLKGLQREEQGGGKERRVA